MRIDSQWTEDGGKVVHPRWSSGDVRSADMAYFRPVLQVVIFWDRIFDF